MFFVNILLDLSFFTYCGSHNNLDYRLKNVLV